MHPETELYLAGLVAPHQIPEQHRLDIALDVLVGQGRPEAFRPVPSSFMAGVSPAEADRFARSLAHAGKLEVTDSGFMLPERHIVDSVVEGCYAIVWPVCGHTNAAEKRATAALLMPMLRTHLARAVRIEPAVALEAALWCHAPLADYDDHMKASGVAIYAAEAAGTDLGELVTTMVRMLPWRRPIEELVDAALAVMA